MDFKNYFEDLPVELNATGDCNELKLLKLFTFNAYFNADPMYIDDVFNGITFQRDNDFGIDGVFINTSLEDNTIEILYSYWVEGNGFELQKVMNIVSRLHAYLSDISRRVFSSNNIKAEQLISDSLSDSETKTVSIRIITNYQPDDPYQLAKAISNYDVSIPLLNVSATISFGEDIIQAIDSNVAPYDYVEQDKLVVDGKENILRFGDNSFICNISAKSLKQLWKREGSRGLLAMNLRYYIPRKAIDNKIEESIYSKHDTFWHLNNGILIVCDDFNFVGNELRMSHFSIVNGGQTTRMIGEINFEDDFYLTCKVIKNTFSDTYSKNEFIANVAEATNTQKAITPKDTIANRIEQRNLKSILQDNGIFVEIKRGEKPNKAIFKEPWQKTKNNELAQALFSFVYMSPGPARNSVSTILQNQEKYDTLFVNHSYPVGFYKSLLFLMKAYKEYSTVVYKDPNADNTKKGLVKNGTFYMLGVIGYVLKLYYNTEFHNNMQKYQNNEAMFELYSSELAFVNSFIETNQTYGMFKAFSFDMFDYIFEKLITPTFEFDKLNAPTLAYSNWTKTNTGFDKIRGKINKLMFYDKDYSLINNIVRYFAKISQDQMNENIDTYVDYVKKNKKIKAKDSAGNVLNNNDEALRNELMIYRMNKSNQSHMSENKIFSDKLLDKLVISKPINKKELSNIVGPSTTYYCGDDILNIIAKYL